MAQLEQTTSCVSIEGVIADDSNLDYLRDAIGIVTAFLDTGGFVVLDAIGNRWWTADDWKQHLFEPADFNPFVHVSLVESVSESDGTHQLYTQGMLKFGRPDLQIQSVESADRDGIIQMLNRFIGFHALGAVIPDGQAIRMASVPDGLVCAYETIEQPAGYNNLVVNIVSEAV